MKLAIEQSLLGIERVKIVVILPDTHYIQLKGVLSHCNKCPKTVPLIHAFWISCLAW